MRDLDFGPHRRCLVCRQLMPERRMLERSGKWFCGLTHALAHEREPQPARPRLVSSSDDKEPP